MGGDGKIVRTVVVVGNVEPKALQNLQRVQSAFLEMVHTAVEWGVRGEKYGYMALYGHFYRAFREEFTWLPADYIQEALRTAAQVLKSWRELKKLDVVKKS